MRNNQQSNAIRIEVIFLEQKKMTKLKCYNDIKKWEGTTLTMKTNFQPK